MTYRGKLKSRELNKQAIGLLAMLGNVSPDASCWRCSILYKLFIIYWGWDAELGLPHSRWMPSQPGYGANLLLWPNEYLMIYGSGTAPSGEEEWERRVHSRRNPTTSLCDHHAGPEPRTFAVNSISQRTRGDNMSTKRWGATASASVQFQSSSGLVKFLPQIRLVSVMVIIKIMMPKVRVQAASPWVKTLEICKWSYDNSQHSWALWQTLAMCEVVGKRLPLGSTAKARPPRLAVSAKREQLHCWNVLWWGRQAAL